MGWLLRLEGLEGCEVGVGRWGDGEGFVVGFVGMLALTEFIHRFGLQLLVSCAIWGTIAAFVGKEQKWVKGWPDMGSFEWSE